MAGRKCLGGSGSIFGEGLAGPFPLDGGRACPEPAEGPVIDGYTGVQRLLLSWAQVWQQKSREAETLRLLTIDPHSPNEFRCNQIVRNIDAFYDAFGIKPGDPMYVPPEQRVRIW